MRQLDHWNAEERFFEPPPGTGLAEPESHFRSRRAVRRLKPSDRRQCQRYQAAGQGIRVHLCRTLNGRARVSHSLLIEISLSGARLLVDELPRVGEICLVRMDLPGETEWNEAKVIAVREIGQGPHLCQVHFPQGCLYRLFREVLLTNVEELEDVEPVNDWS